MRTNIKIGTALACLIAAAGAAMPACLAESEAALEASSYSQSNNNSEQNRQNSTESLTSSGTEASRENRTESSMEASGPVNTGAINLSSPKISSPVIWGNGPAWGAPPPAPGMGVEIGQKLTASKVHYGPIMRVNNLQQPGAKVAIRTFSSRTTLRRGARENARYAYLKKEIKQAERSM